MSILSDGKSMQLEHALTDEIIEAQECASELTVAFHNHPYARPDTSIDQFCGSKDLQSTQDGAFWTGDQPRGRI